MTEPTMPDEFMEHYSVPQKEYGRHEEWPIESIRTMEILQRYLPPPPARILDVGGGPGFYARRLTQQGYEVHLIDPVPSHIQEALAPHDDGPSPASATAGDARRVPQADGTFDAVLLLGPLYHLTKQEDRIQALTEAHRVLVDGGPVFAAAISRFASAMDGLYRSFVDDARFVEIMKQDLLTGQHRNPTDQSDYFTTCFFHRPDELQKEMKEAGFADARVLAVEGISWAAPDLNERIKDLQKREIVLDILRQTEDEPSILGASPHLIGFGHASR